MSRPILLPLLLAALAAACQQPVDRSPLLKGVPLHEVAISPTKNDLSGATLRVPEGYDVDELAETRADKFLIGRSSDTEPVPGQIVLTFTESPAPLLLDTAGRSESLGEIAGERVTWMQRTLEEGGPPIYQREVVSKDLLGRFNESRSTPLWLHVIVAGADSMTVERLMASVETLRFLPAKANV